MTTGDGYTLSGFLVVGLIMLAVFVVALLVGGLARGSDNLVGRVPRINARRKREADARAARWADHEAERRELDRSRAELVRSWRQRELSYDERRLEYRDWRLEHDENNPYQFDMLDEWERRFGPKDGVA